jgi:hypothetical protein
LAQDIANQLRGGDMAIAFDQIFAKRAASGDSAFLWHQDAAYWPPLESDTSAVNCWLAVSNVMRDNGCLRYIPGSHREAALRPHRPGELCSAGGGQEAVRMRSWPTGFTVVEQHDCVTIWTMLTSLLS